MEAFNQISEWAHAGAPWPVVTGATLVALCFVVFNTMRILLYLPQLITCIRDDLGCPTINLWTWSSWIVANASTGLYMWIFQGDLLGLALNIGNAAMCVATVAVTLVKRRALDQSTVRSSPHLTATFTVHPRLPRSVATASRGRGHQAEGRQWT